MYSTDRGVFPSPKSNFSSPMRELAWHAEWRCRITEPSYHGGYDWKPTVPAKGATKSARELNELGTNPRGNSWTRSSKRRSG